MSIPGFSTTSDFASIKNAEPKNSSSITINEKKRKASHSSDEENEKSSDLNKRAFKKLRSEDKTESSNTPSAPLNEKSDNASFSNLNNWRKLVDGKWYVSSTAILETIAKDSSTKMTPEQIKKLSKLSEIFPNVKEEVLCNALQNHLFNIDALLESHYSGKVKIE